MHIAVAQLNSTPGALKTTFARMLAQAQAAAEKGCDLVCFPLPLFCGMKPGALTEREEYFNELMVCAERFARETPIAALVGVVLESPMGTLHDAVLFSEGTFQVLGFSQNIARLAGAPNPGVGRASFELGGVRCSVAFEYGQLLGFSEQKFEPGEAPQVIVYLSPDAYCADEESTLLAPAVANGAYAEVAQATGAWLVAVGSVGGYDDEVFAGGSFIMAPWGELAAVAPSFEEGCIDYDVVPSFEGPLAEPVSAQPYERNRALWEALALGLHDFVEKTGLSGVVVPVTGDITSTVTVVLAVDALGPTKVHAMLLPRHDSFGTAEYCRELALNLRIGFEDPLSAEIGEYSRGLSRQMEAWGDERSVARRLHTDLSNVMLAHRSRELGGCVLGVSDKTGIATEWTLQACSSAAFEPFGDVYRTDVCALARLRNTISPVIPEQLLGFVEVPSGLDLERYGASAERQLSELDAALYLHIEQGEGISGMVADGMEAEFAQAVMLRMAETSVWRSRAPLAPSVSSAPLALLSLPVALSREVCDVPVEPEEAEGLFDDLMGRMLGRAFEKADGVPGGIEEAFGLLGDLLSGQFDGEYDVSDDLGEFADGEFGGSFWDDGMFSQN